MEEKNHKFLCALYPIIRDYEEDQFPNLRDIFRPEAIDWLLTKSLEYDIYDENQLMDPEVLVDFIINTGYKDEPIVDEDGKPLVRRTTPVHHADRRCNEDKGILIPKLFKIYDSFDVNYTNDDGDTHFHLACEYGCDDVVEKFLKLGQDPNYTSQESDSGSANPPLHFALWRRHKKVAELLLRNGADPNVANAAGLTSLHIICKDFHDDHDLVQMVLELSYNEYLPVKVDAPDNLGRTPLQLAVTSFCPRVIDALIDRGADLSNFVFPTEAHFDKGYEERYFKSVDSLKLLLGSGVLGVVECLEKRGYELKPNDALTLMAFFAKHELFETSTRLQCLLNREEFTKRLMINSSLSLYDLIRLRPEKASKLLTYKDCLEFANSNRVFGNHRKFCAEHLCEKLSRGFFRRWALLYFLELTRYRLPILCCEMIIKQLINEDLWHICQAATGQSS